MGACGLERWDSGGHEEACQTVGIDEKARNIEYGVVECLGIIQIC